MKDFPMHHRPWLLAALAFVPSFASCGSTGQDPSRQAIEASDPREQAPPAPWTSAFGHPAVLLAEEIYVEGPTDLVDHLAIHQHPDLEYRVETVEEGLRQEIRLGSRVGGLEIKAQLDAWELVALKRMVVLQRPSWGPVKVRAFGNAWWTLADESDQRRDDVLDFVGERGK